MPDQPFQPLFSGYAARVRDSFARQSMMATMGADLTTTGPGHLTIQMPFHPGFTQQHGFLHGGAVASVLDSACGYAALSLMDADSAVLTIEFKINFAAPARGHSFRFAADVIKSGRTVILTEGRATSLATDGSARLIATMTATMMAVRGRGISD